MNVNGSLSRIFPLAALLILGGCVSDGGPGPMASGGAGLAFDSIDGPPPQVFERFVGALNAEAQARALPTASRQAPAAYRVRAYLAAQTSRKQTAIAWVFDVYDSAQRRNLRLSGEEPAGDSTGSDAWTAADEQVLQRIARKGMAEIASMMQAGSNPPSALPPQPADGPATPAPAPAASGPAVASAAATAPAAGPADTSAEARAALAFNGPR